LTDKATLMSVQVPETFESTVVLADNLRQIHVINGNKKFGT